MLLNRGPNGFGIPFNGQSGGGDWPLTLDFENDSYTSATATYTLADVWESDTDWFFGGDLGKEVSGQGIVVDQLNEHESYHFTDAFAELVHAGPIVVFKFTVINQTANDGINIAAYDLTNFNAASATISHQGSNLQDHSGNNTPVTSNISTGDHTAALLVSKTRLAISIDGGAVVGIDNPSPDTFDRIAIDVFTAGNSGESTILRSATFRDPAEGEAALPTLSA